VMRVRALRVHWHSPDHISPNRKNADVAPRK
jgi:hypothetical protein